MLKGHTYTTTETGEIRCSCGRLLLGHTSERDTNKLVDMLGVAYDHHAIQLLEVAWIKQFYTPTT